MIETLAMQCADVCAAMALGICIGMITGALVTYQLVREAWMGKKKRTKSPRCRREPFDGRAWIKHYERISGIERREER